MPTIRNLALIKRFTDYFKLKTNDMLSSLAGNMLVPVVSIPVPPNIIQVLDTVANDSDKTFTVPDGKQWKILYGFVLITTSAQAGNRTMEYRVSDADDNIIYFVQAVNPIVASVTETLTFGQFADVSESLAIRHLIPIPNKLILSSGFSFRIRDSAGIDPAVDDMTVRFIIDETDLTSE